ncbi:glycosyltransferase [Nocardioides aestuarii]|uniref:Glycosyltransferase n=1 Tax=Nocardioides aestuarii TaxID=252231 RepID=A0ABW4TJG6_9ACTN
MKHVAILQEYVPSYRVPFFRALSDKALSVGVRVEVHAGRPIGDQALRGDDAGEQTKARHMPQRELSACGRRVTLRSLTSLPNDLDLVVLEQARRNLDTYRLLLPRRMWHGQRVALWGHGRDYVKKERALDSAILARLTSRADHFFAYTRQGAEHVIAQGRRRETVTVVRNSVDTQALQADLAAVSAEDVRQFQHHHGLTGKTLLYLGGLDRSKRIEFLLDAFARAHSADPDIRLLVVGDGDQREIVSGRPGVVPLGRLTGRDKSLAMRAANAIANPGRVGLVAVESIIAELPLLTADGAMHAPEFDYLEELGAVLQSPNSPHAYASLLAAGAGTGDPALRPVQDRLRGPRPTFGIESMADNFLEGILLAIRNTGASHE